MINILIVDDSAIVRKILTEELSAIEDFNVIDTATDPYMAREKIAQMRPDVITLDVEMPRMDGLSFLAKLMEHFPVPVVVVSSLTPKNSKTALRALELGAIEVVSKPYSGFTNATITPLVRAIRAAAHANMSNQIKYKKTNNAFVPKNNFSVKTNHNIIAIGASTGGTKAIETILQKLPSNIPGIVIVQHMPEVFTASFAARLNSICKIDVKEARDNDQIVPGVALVAPGNHHLLLQSNGINYSVTLKDGPHVHHQRPSVDVFFHSVARNAGKNAVGLILSGMGADGAEGLRSMHDNGAFTIAQDEASCVVFGMSKEAIKLGAVDKIVHVDQCANLLLDFLSRKNV